MFTVLGSDHPSIIEAYVRRQNEHKPYPKMVLFLHEVRLIIPLMLSKFDDENSTWRYLPQTAMVALPEDLSAFSCTLTSEQQLWVKDYTMRPVGELLC